MMLSNQNILITGGAGSIGSALAERLGTENSVMILGRDGSSLMEVAARLPNVDVICADVTNDSLWDGVGDFYPDIIFHCAALKHVSMCESQPEVAVEVNVQGTLNVLKMAEEQLSLVVNVSSDKVVNAHSVYGMTKRLSERCVQLAGGVSVRLGNVEGSRGSVFPIWEQLAHRVVCPLTVIF